MTAVAAEGARIAVLGERARVEGYALGGALAVPADGPEEVEARWDGLGAEVAVVVLTRAAAEALGDRTRRRPGVLTVVMPP